MTLILKENYSGFSFLEVRQIPEANSKGYHFIHEKTGAELVYLSNDDENKVFSIAFRTLPEDSTGVFHILEHSVLCGSKNYPSKEPFVELLKGSLKTFLNAFTFPDKTMYPVASTNAKDFRNLITVYLDAVFYPNLLQDPEIFMQEGWHYELENPDEAMTLKGVVYNEMLGAFSAPEQVLWRKTKSLLFPDTIYNGESGGDPEEIPALTYERFCEFHKKCYHPSNSVIVLYGNGNIESDLAFIDSAYLSQFSRSQAVSGPMMQAPFSKEKVHSLKYAISREEPLESKNWFSYSWVTGDSVNYETAMGLDILNEILMGTPASPLKNTLLAANLGQDVYALFEQGIRQPIWSITLKNAPLESREPFRRIIFDTLADLKKNGIEADLIEAALNSLEFRLRESDFGGFPKGIVYAISAVDGVFFANNPFHYLEYEQTLKKIRTAAQHGFFEQLIQQYLLENKHSLLLTMEPEPGLAEKRAETTHQTLQRKKEKFSDADIKEIIKKTKELKARQSRADRPEDLEKLPHLTLSDVEPVAKQYIATLGALGKQKLLHYDIFTNQIVYSTLFFELPPLEETEIPLLGLFTALLGKLSTSKKSYQDLSKSMDIHTGGINFSLGIYTDEKNPDHHRVCFTISGKALLDKTQEMTALMGEIALDTQFNQKQRILELLRELKSSHEFSLMSSGHNVAANRLSAYYSQSGRFAELLSGFSFYQYLSQLEKTFEERFEEISVQLKNIKKRIFSRSNLTIGLVNPQQDMESISDYFSALAESFPEIQSKPGFKNLDFLSKNEAIIIPGNVQYIVQGYNFRSLGYKYSGALQVLKQILGLDYLWNRIRVQGGAYGAFANINRLGQTAFLTYRDPNLKNTLDIYRQAADYLRKFDASPREMSKYILGTISQLDQPLTPAAQGGAAFMHYWGNIQPADLQRSRDEILSASPDMIRSSAELIEAVINQEYFCVVGSEQKIKADAQLFNRLIPAFGSE
ncbi:MAG TPA: insulinase family protein [Candidatus Marinimicrobia bacterium]|nr:insulinase family protein [Candidatus Neomarinimicrobiota bacterium]